MSGRPGFFQPDSNGGREITPGTILPFLRPLKDGKPDDSLPADTPLTIDYLPFWPDHAPELPEGDTLTNAKFGLPQVRGQKSAMVFYEQSMAGLSPSHSVVLHDPTREKTITLADVGLTALPPSIATTSHLGKNYFQNLSPDLQERIWHDPLRSPAQGGTLVLIGQFVDEPAGEDYLHLNVLTAQQIKDLKALCAATDTKKAGWDGLVTGLQTKVETFIEDPAKRGTYKVGRTENVPVDKLAVITDADTAVDSYAATATGGGDGWVTMVFGNGKAFTPEGDPVQVKVFKVTKSLYTGELKTLYSKNPLDEKVTLRHTGDFAARPEDYVFEWKWAPGSAAAPATYTTSWSQRLGGLNNGWLVVRNPSLALALRRGIYQRGNRPSPFPARLCSGTAGMIRRAGNRPSCLRARSPIPWISPAECRGTSSSAPPWGI